MQTCTKTDILALLKTKMRDATDTVWTEPEKEDALDEAIDDMALCNLVEDSSLTGAIGTFEYTIPSTIDVVLDIYQNIDGKKELLQRDIWEQVNTTLRFRTDLQANGTLTLKGVVKLASDDNIPQVYKNFILYTAGYKLWELLEQEYAGGLLMSDITLAEIASGMNGFMVKAQVERRKFKRNGYKV